MTARWLPGDKGQPRWMDTTDEFYQHLELRVDPDDGAPTGKVAAYLVAVWLILFGFALGFIVALAWLG